MATPSTVFTVHYVAEMLGMDEELVQKIASMGMEPGDGRLYIHHTDDVDAPSLVAFTPAGVENLRELLNEHRPAQP